MKRWSDEEQQALDTIRSRLKDELASVDQNVEVVGDRKLLRFYRGHSQNIDKTCEMIQKFINYRKQYNVDQIRRDIVESMNESKKWPKGELINSLIPGWELDHGLYDKEGSPLVIMSSKFSPTEVLNQISIDDYILYVIHGLEYRSLILEELSEKMEREKVNRLKENPDDPEYSQPYGYIAQLTVVRNLDGLGFEHVGPKGLEIMKSIIGISSDNYPEMMKKTYIVNTPWVFNTTWWFVKGLLQARTIAKVEVVGSNYQAVLQQAIHDDHLPEHLGGTFSGEPKGYIFDISEGGLLDITYKSFI